MHGTRLFLLPLLIAAELLTSYPVQAGKLERVRNETSNSSSSHNDDDDDDDNDDDNSPGLLGSILQGLFDGDSSDEDDNASEHTPSPPKPRAFYLEYPYAGGRSVNLRMVPPLSAVEDARTACPPGVADCGGAVSIRTCAEAECYDDSTPGPPRPPIGLKGARGQLWGEGARDWDGVYQGTLGLGLQFAGEFGVETRGSLWHEPLAGPDDALFFWDGNVLFEIPASRQAQMYLGVGLRGLFDPTGESKAKGGMHGLLRFDVYPTRPLVLRVATTLGGINHAFIAEGQATLGIQLQRFELYGGYNAWIIGETKLHGPLLGVRMTL